MKRTLSILGIVAIGSLFVQGAAFSQDDPCKIGGLPLARAVRCQDEYKKIAAGFDQLLLSHRRVKVPLALGSKKN